MPSDYEKRQKEFLKKQKEQARLQRKKSYEFAKERLKQNSENLQKSANQVEFEEKRRELARRVRREKYAAAKAKKESLKSEPEVEFEETPVKSVVLELVKTIEGLGVAECRSDEADGFSQPTIDKIVYPALYLVPDRG